MKLLGQIGIIFGICLVGELISSLLPFAFPASIISLVLLFLLLWSRVLKIDHIQMKADFLLQNMAFFFIPAGVGIIEYADIMKTIWWQLLVICLVTTLLVFAATTWTVMGVMAIQKRIKERAA